MTGVVLQAPQIEGCLADSPPIDIHQSGAGQFRPAANSGLHQASVSLDSWPIPLHSDAFHGITGRIVKTLEPHSEADPFSLLIQFLVAFGNIVGSGPHFLTEADRQRTNLFVAVVGQTAK